MQHRFQIERTRADVPGRPGRKTAVIADDGVAAALVVLETAHPATPGQRFTHAGRTWVIRGERHGSRVLVATPADGTTL